MTGASAVLIHASNRLERLADRLAEEILRHPGDPLAPERIVVPHPTLGRWLRLELASRLGVAAHLRIELPAQFMWAIMRETVGDLPAEQSFAPEALRWRIFSELAQWDRGGDPDRYMAAGWDRSDDLDRHLVAGAAGAADIRLAGADRARRQLELATRLADVYDRCMLFRPDWIRAWQAGDTPHWQVVLWARLTGTATAPRHWVEAIDAYRDALAHGPPGEEVRRERASLFGIAHLSPSYLDALRSTSPRMDIHLYMLSPCREFWADTRSPRERTVAASDEAADGYYEEGNELLSYWGRPARDMQAMLAEELGVGAPDDDTTYGEPEAGTRLGVVQGDILELRSAAQSSPSPLPPDRSLQIHVCHSPSREAEVLHDRLLDLFDAHDDIQPADVLVLVPRLDEYAPAVEAVFGAFDAIPFHIGRQRRGEGAAVRAFLDLLALPGGRYAAPDVLAPLQAESVRMRFGIGDLAEVRDQVARAGIRWGIDAAHRAALEAPASDGHTWRFGLRRLLLGVALPADAPPLRGIAPCAADRFGLDASADDYERLGRFVRYCEQTFRLNAWMQDALSPAQWFGRLRTEVVDAFFVSDGRRADPGPGRASGEVEQEVDAVLRLIDGLVEECRVAECETPIPFAVLRDALNERAADSARAGVRLTNGVTVGQLATGQVFPAKVVCVMGLNDGAFPRFTSPASFDLVGVDRRQLGDRDVRDEDRFAFLEALLAARRSFLLTCTGRDLRENTSIPPSVVVSELKDYLGQRFSGQTEGVEIHHPLQPFSRRYFDATDAELFSYSPAMAAAARAAATGGVTTLVRTDPQPFAGCLPATVAPVEIDLDALIRFFHNTSKHYVRHRLGMSLETGEDVLDEEEPLELDALARWQLRSDIAGSVLDGADAGPGEDGLRARGLLPPANVGRIAHRHAEHAVAPLLEALAPFEDHRRAPAREVDITVAGVRVTGEVTGYHAGERELLWWRTGEIRAKDRIEVWLRLLALASAGDGPRRAHLIGVSKVKVTQTELLAPDRDEAIALLSRWLDAWRGGQSAPLPFYPDTSWGWATGKDPHKAAMNAWCDEWRGRGEGDDEYHRLMVGDDPVSEAFGRLAEELLIPLSAARE